jgi:hypothetical protein
MQPNLKHCSSICISRIRKATETLGQDIWSSGLDLNVGDHKYKTGVITIYIKPETNINIQGMHATLHVLQVLIITIHELSGNIDRHAGKHLLVNFKEFLMKSIHVQLQEAFLITHATE